MIIKDVPVDPASNAAPANMVVVLNWVEELKAKVKSAITAISRDHRSTEF